MKVWKMLSAGVLELSESPGLPVLADEVKIKVAYSSVGHTDKFMFEGKISPSSFPVVPGRDCAGLVIETGANVTNVSRGDRVYVDPYICCDACRGRLEGNCEKFTIHGRGADGFMRDYAVVKACEIYKLPEHVADKEAEFIEYTAMAINAVNRIGLQKGEHIVINGANVIGLILAEVALYYQAIPIVVDRRKDRLAIAENAGVYYTINTVEQDAAKEIFAITGGRMADVVAHMAVSLSTVNFSLEYAARGGRVVLIGTDAEGLDLSGGFNRVLEKQLSVIGVGNGFKSISAAINMLANKTVNVKDLVFREVPFADLAKALKEQDAYTDMNLRVIVKIG